MQIVTECGWLRPTNPLRVDLPSFLSCLGKIIEFRNNTSFRTLTELNAVFFCINNCGTTKFSTNRVNESGDCRHFATIFFFAHK